MLSQLDDTVEIKETTQGEKNKGDDDGDDDRDESEDYLSELDIFINDGMDLIGNINDLVSCHLSLLLSLPSLSLSPSLGHSHG